MRRIAIINQKGGVGKTTTTVNVGAALARAGQRVLMIDLDPQAHMTLHLGLNPADDRPGIYHVLTGSTSIAAARTRVANNLWVVGASIDLAAAEVELVSVVGREVILRDLLDQHGGGNGFASEQYDYVLMDCPPSLGVLTLNGLCAAKEVIIPLQPHYLALQGLSKLLETVSLVNRRINPSLSVSGVAICMKEAGTRLGAEVVEDVRSFLESARNTPVPWGSARLYDTMIRRNIKLAEAPSYGQSIFDYANDSNGSKDYELLAAEIHDPTGVNKLVQPSPSETTAATPVEAAGNNGHVSPAAIESEAAVGAVVSMPVTSDELPLPSPVAEPAYADSERVDPTIAGREVSFHM
jgi:chromosome partitioning protein